MVGLPPAPAASKLMCASTWASTDAAPATHDALAPVPPDVTACPAPVGTHSHAGAADATPPVPHDIPATTATTTRPRILRPFRSGTDAVRSTRARSHVTRRGASVVAEPQRFRRKPRACCNALTIALGGWSGNATTYVRNRCHPSI